MSPWRLMPFGCQGQDTGRVTPHPDFLTILAGHDVPTLRQMQLTCLGVRGEAQAPEHGEAYPRAAEVLVGERLAHGDVQKLVLPQIA